MDLSKIKPIYLILVVVLGFALWKLPDALQHSQANEQSQKELDSYLAVKEKALTPADNLAIKSFLRNLAGIFKKLDEAQTPECQLASDHPKPRIIDWNLLWYSFQAGPSAKSRDIFFDKVSTLNSQNPFPRLNLTVGDGFTQDIANENWNPGTLTYIQNLQQENILFIAKLENVRDPKFNGDDSFQTGIATIGIWACDLSAGKVLCKHTLHVNSDDSSGLPLKTAPMNNKLRIELLEKSVEEVKNHCRKWMTESVSK